MFLKNNLLGLFPQNRKSDSVILRSPQKVAISSSRKIPFSKKKLLSAVRWPSFQKISVTGFLSWFLIVSICCSTTISKKIFYYCSTQHHIVLLLFYPIHFQIHMIILHFHWFKFILFLVSESPQSRQRIAFAFREIPQPVLSKVSASSKYLEYSKV
jgi:hypothetical protein